MSTEAAAPSATWPSILPGLLATPLVSVSWWGTALLLPESWPDVLAYVWLLVPELVALGLGALLWRRGQRWWASGVLSGAAVSALLTSWVSFLVAGLQSSSL